MSKLRFMMIGRGQPVAASGTPEEPPPTSGLYVQTGTPMGYLVGAVTDTPVGATVTMERTDADDGGQLFTYANGNIYTSLTATDIATASSHTVTLTCVLAGVTTRQSYTIGVVAAGVLRKFPISQSVNFGAKTLRGFGGHHLNYLGSAPTLRIVSQVDSVGATVSLWDIDALNKLIISYNGSSYGATPPTLTGGPYTIVVTDESVTTTVTVTIVANQYHIAPNTADTATTSQFSSTINKTTTGVVAYGDQVIFRPGVYFRGGGVQDRLVAMPVYNFQKTATFTGTAPVSVSDANWVTCRAEVKNTQMSYARFALLTGGATVNLYMQFHELNWRGMGTDPATTTGGTPPWETQGAVEFGNATGGQFNWYMFTKCVFSIDNYPGETGQNTRSGRCAVVLRGANSQNAWWLDNLLDNFVNGIHAYGKGNVHIVGNEFRKAHNNEIIFINVETGGTTLGWSSVSWNFGWDIRRPVRQANPATGTVDGSPHLDHWQVVYSSTAGVDIQMNTHCVGNLWGTLALSKVAQGTLQTPTSSVNPTDPGNVLWANINVYGNAYFDGYGQGIGFENSDMGVCKWNAVLTPPDLMSTDTLPSINHGGGAISRVTRFDSTKNIAAGSCTSSRGAGVTSDNLTFVGTTSNATASKTEMLTLFNGPTFGPNLITKQAFIDCLTTKGAAVGYGPMGVGCDHIAQTATFPDGYTYSRPYALIN